MRILILGGTKFLGRALAEAGLARGHELTLFNRGETNPELFPEAEQLRGDRKGDLSALEGRTWDAVIDTSGYVPADVRASAELLRESGRYVFVSSVSAYADFSTGPTEASPVAELNGLPVDELASDYSNYGPLKALCEIEVERVFGERALIVRPGLIVGPHDPTRPLHVLGAPARARRRDPRAWAAGAARAVRGRPGSRDLDPRRGRARALGHVQRDERRCSVG